MPSTPGFNSIGPDRAEVGFVNGQLAVKFNGESAFHPVDGLSQICISDVIDFTTVADNLNLNVPRRPGFFYVTFRWAIIVYSFAGALTSGNLTLKWGNNATHDNLNSQALTTASLANVPGQTPEIFYNNPAPQSVPLIDSNIQIVGRISTVYVGSTTLTGRLALFGVWIPTS